MKRLISIFLLLVAMTTATFAGTGVTTTIQNRTLSVQVVDNNVYNVTILSDTQEVLATGVMAQRYGTLTIDMPEGNNYRIIVTNIQTEVTEVTEVTSLHTE